MKNPLFQVMKMEVKKMSVKKKEVKKNPPVQYNRTGFIPRSDSPKKPPLKTVKMIHAIDLPKCCLSHRLFLENKLFHALYSYGSWRTFVK